MKLSKHICLGLLLFVAAPLWSQVNSTSAQASLEVLGPGSSDDQMKTPPPVSGQPYPTQVTSEERSNYLRGGVAFTGAYTDNALGSLSTKPVSDESYSIGPTLALDETRSRLHFVLTYAPGFTFYQHTSSRNEADQNVSFDLHYRLSPHVTFTAQDGFLKTSNVLNQQNFAPAGPVSGGAQEPNFSVIPPIADLLSNSGNVGLSYQFAPNGMVGATGSFTNLHYPNPAQVPGLYDSNSQAGSAFYSLRISKMHYIGATYQYQRLIAYPTAGQSETQTHALLFFYTLYATSRFSVSFFGGPQHSDTIEPPQPPLLTQGATLKAWTPAAGASMSWQGRLSTFAASYSRVISGGGGLVGAVQLNTATASFRQQMTRRLSASLAGSYTQNDVLASAFAASNNGHSVAGTASLQQQVGPHINLQAGYTRLHQVYSNVAVLAGTPDTNREFCFDFLSVLQTAGTMNSMSDDLDEKSSQGFDLHHYLEMVRRRHLQFLIPLFVGWALVWGASWVLSPRYQSTTLILVEQPTMPRDYVTPNVNDNLQERMQSITQQILSRTRLLHIIDQLDLYADARSQPSPDQKVDRMRKDIDIELVRDNRNQITAFNVSYSSPDPRQAQQVTSELTNLFINENLEVRQQQSEDTTKFSKANSRPPGGLWQTRKIRSASSRRCIPASCQHRWEAISRFSPACNPSCKPKKVR